MKKMMIWAILALAILVAALVYGWYWSSTNRVAPPIDRGPVVNKICNSLSKGYLVESYADNNRTVGGYIVHDPQLDGGSTYYYDSDGALFASGSAMQTVRDTELSKKISEWRNEVVKKYPNKEVIECGS